MQPPGPPQPASYAQHPAELNDADEQEESSFKRDEDGVAVLPAEEWFYDEIQNAFINTRTFDVTPLNNACCVINYGYRSNLGRKPNTAGKLGVGNAAPASNVAQQTADYSHFKCASSPFSGSKAFDWGVVQFALENFSSKVDGERIWTAARQASTIAFNHMGTHCHEADAAGEAIVKLVAPELRKVHPAANLKLSSSFVVHYPSGSEGHAPHVDSRSDLTINLCLGKDFDGGEMIFMPVRPVQPNTEIESGFGLEPPSKRSPAAPPQLVPTKPPSPRSVAGGGGGMMGFVKNLVHRRSPSPTRSNSGDAETAALPARQELAPESFMVPHVIGHAIMHPSSLEHATQPVSRGERYNLVLFCSVEYEPFDFVRLPSDLRRYIAGFLDAQTLVNLSFTCRAGRTAATADELWLRLARYHPLWRQNYADARDVFAAGSMTGRQLFQALQQLQSIQNGMGSVIQSKLPQMMCKETYQMSIERRARESIAAEHTALRALAAAGWNAPSIPKRQFFVHRPAQDFCPLPFLPSSLFAKHYARPLAAPAIGPSLDDKDVEVQPTSVETAVPGYRNVFRRGPEAPSHRVGLRDVLKLHAPATDVPKARFLDTDGTDMTTYPYFWPIRDSPSLSIKSGIRFQLMCEINGNANEYTLSILYGGGCSNYFLQVKNNQVVYRTQTERETPRYINTENGNELRGPFESFAALARQLEALGVHPVRWPLAPRVPPTPGRVEAQPWPQCKSCYRRFAPGTHDICKK